MLSNMLMHTISVEPLEKDGDTQVFGAPVTMKAFVQALDTDAALQADGIFEFNYKFYTKVDANIKSGDRVTFDGEVYRVKNVQKNRATTHTSHLRGIMYKVKT